MKRRSNRLKSNEAEDGKASKIPRRESSNRRQSSRLRSNASISDPMSSSVVNAIKKESVRGARRAPERVAKSRDSRFATVTQQKKSTGEQPSYKAESKTRKLPSRAAKNTSQDSTSALTQNRNSYYRFKTPDNSDVDEGAEESNSQQKTKLPERQSPIRRSLRSNASIMSPDNHSSSVSFSIRSLKDDLRQTSKETSESEPSDDEDAEAHGAEGGDEESKVLKKESPMELNEESKSYSNKESDDRRNVLSLLENGDGRKKHERKHKTPNYLDEKTLAAFKSYFSTESVCEALDDDAIVLFMAKMDRLAIQQKRYQDELLGCDSDDSDGLMFDELLLEEEDHALGHELFRTIVAKIQETKKGLTLDKRTMSWIKRAAGLHRHSGGHKIGSHEESRNKDEKRNLRNRRLTRGMAHTTRKNKRAKGLNFLTGALEDLEKEVGRFKRKKPYRERPLSPYQADDESVATNSELSEDSSPERRTWEGLIARVTKKKKRIGGEAVKTTREVRVVRVLVGGDNIDDKTDIDLLDLKHRRNRKRQEAQSRFKRKLLKSEAPSLRLMDWKRRKVFGVISTNDTKAKREAVKAEKDTLAKYQKRVDKGLPPGFNQAGIVYRLPRWDSLVEKPPIAGMYFCAADPPRLRHSDEVYASFCSKLMNCLRGDARSWASCEFFHSDIDREWFNRNEFLEDAARLGVRPGTLLTRREWRAVRRRIPNKPSRFSRRFIASQLNKRNLYRNTVRMLQRHPEMSTRIKFPYDVVAPIPVGSTVTAYSSTYRILHRGTVLSYDATGARYLIQFERKEFGHEFVPDTEVATHGEPAILIRAPSRTISEVYNGIFGYYRSVSSLTSSCGSSYGPIEGTKQDSTCIWKMSDELEKITHFKPLDLSNKTGSPVPSSKKRNDAPRQSQFRLLEEAAEHEIFVNLLCFVERATARKKLLLTGIEKSHALMVQRLPFGGISSESGLSASQHFEQHYAWLHANLERTNNVLGRALDYVRILYGKAYLSSRAPESLNKSRLTGDTIHSVLPTITDLPRPAYQWILKLSQDAGFLGDIVAASLDTNLSTTRTNKKKNGGGSDIDRLVTMKDRLGAASELLLATTFGQSMSNKIEYPAMSIPISLGSDKLFDLNLPAASDTQELYAEMMAARDDAMKDFNEAMGLLDVELAIGSVDERKR